MLPTWDILGHFLAILGWWYGARKWRHISILPKIADSQWKSEDIWLQNDSNSVLCWLCDFHVFFKSTTFFFNMWKSHKVSHRPLEIHGNPPEVRAARCLAALLSFLDFDAQKLSVWGEPRVHLGAGETWWNSLVKLTCETNMRIQWCCLKWLLASGVSISRSSGWWSTIIIYNSPRWYLSGLQCIHYRTW